MRIWVHLKTYYSLMINPLILYLEVNHKRSRVMSEFAVSNLEFIFTNQHTLGLANSMLRDMSFLYNWKVLN